MLHFRKTKNLSKYRVGRRFQNRFEHFVNISRLSEADFAFSFLEKLTKCQVKNDGVFLAMEEKPLDYETKGWNTAN